MTLTLLLLTVPLLLAALLAGAHRDGRGARRGAQSSRPGAHHARPAVRGLSAALPSVPLGPARAAAAPSGRRRGRHAAGPAAVGPG
ncbi:hypothetical protein [Kitasatospora sp. NBC_00315]|uniref:hypothetical protein n=1 Tax=Kitasatospora sp. NBC_00315 TaxID=2975963 RepID=UPI003244BD38